MQTQAITSTELRSLTLLAMKDLGDKALIVEDRTFRNTPRQVAVLISYELFNKLTAITEQTSPLKEP